jgi:hypothetical protein
MDYQYANGYQINNLDYWSLVNMLMVQITPETRKQILDRLTEMNNLLLIGMGAQIQSPPSIPSIASIPSNSRKKDISELPHPSMNHVDYKGPNPLPLNMPTNNNNQSIMNNSYQMIPSLTIPMNNYKNMGQYNTQPTNEVQEEIDLDDLMCELHNKPDELDEKLFKIKKLHEKIITERRKRKKENK